MRTYSMNFRDVMGLPMQVFWQLSGDVERLQAEEHKRLLEVLRSSQDGDAAKELHEALHKLSPDPVKLSPVAIIAAAKLDKGGLNDLRRMQ